MFTRGKGGVTHSQMGCHHRQQGPPSAHFTCCRRPARLLIANHPDKGGSTYIASKINEAGLPSAVIFHPCYCASDSRCFSDAASQMLLLRCFQAKEVMLGKKSTH